MEGLLLRVLEDLAKANGLGLRTIKHSGIIQQDGKILWKDKSLKLKFTDNVLTEVKHVVTGEKGTIPKGMHITTEYNFTNCWCAEDFRAQLKPMPPIKLSGLFGSGKAATPFATPSGGNYKQAKQALEVYINAVDAKWKADLAKLQGNQEDKDRKVQVEEAIARRREEEGRATMEKVQKRAAIALEERDAKRVCRA